jgi:hypothetical protein
VLSDAGRNPPCTLRSTSIAASRDDRRAPNYRPRPNRASLDEERPRRPEGGAPDRMLSCRLWIERVNALDRRARPLRSRQGDSDEGVGRRTSAGMDSKSIRACRSTQRPSRRQNGPSPAASEAQREKTNAGDRGICLYSLVAVGLPHHHGVGVGGLAGGDHGGRAVMPELAPHYGLLFFFPVTPRWTCTRGFARVGSCKQLSGKHDKTEACFRLRGRIYGVCSVMTPKSPSHGKNRL